MRLKYSSLEKANFKTIEFELYHLDASKKTYKEHQDNIIHGKGLVQEVRGTHVSKPTEAKAVKLVSSLHLQEMQKRIEAIDYVLKILPEIKLELVKEKYFKRQYTDSGIMQKLNIEQATFYRYKREIIELIADRLGWQV